MTRNDPTPADDSPDTDSTRSRRAFLGEASALGTIALAGCTGSHVGSETTTTEMMTTTTEETTTDETTTDETTTEAPTDPEVEPMSIWIDLARVATGLNLLLLALLASVRVRNYRRVRSKHTLGMVVFAALLFAERVRALLLPTRPAPVGLVQHERSRPGVASDAAVSRLGDAGYRLSGVGDAGLTGGRRRILRSPRVYGGAVLRWSRVCGTCSSSWRRHCSGRLRTPVPSAPTARGSHADRPVRTIAVVG